MEFDCETWATHRSAARSARIGEVGRTAASSGLRMAADRVREFAFSPVHACGLTEIVRRTIQRRRVTILGYHDPTPAQLDRHLTILRESYTFVRLLAVVDALERGVWDGLPPSAVVLTLDDGHHGNAALRPVLRDHNVHATIFAVSAVVGTSRRFWFNFPMPVATKAELKRVRNTKRIARLRELGFEDEAPGASREALSRDEILALEEVAVVEAHTRFHPILTACTDEEAEEEIAGSKRELETLLETKVSAFAYPNGDYSEREKRLVREAGFRCAVTSSPGYVDLSSDRFALPRFMMNEEAGRNEVVTTACGAWGFVRPIAKRLLNRPGD